MEKDGVRAALKRWEWEVRVVESDGARCPQGYREENPGQARPRHLPRLGRALSCLGPGPARMGILSHRLRIPGQEQETLAEEPGDKLNGSSSREGLKILETNSPLQLFPGLRCPGRDLQRLWVLMLPS